VAVDFILLGQGKVAKLREVEVEAVGLKTIELVGEVLYYSRLVFCI